MKSLKEKLKKSEIRYRKSLEMLLANYEKYGVAKDNNYYSLLTNWALYAANDEELEYEYESLFDPRLIAMVNLKINELKWTAEKWHKESNVGIRTIKKYKNWKDNSEGSYSIKETTVRTLLDCIPNFEYRLADKPVAEEPVAEEPEIATV